LAAILEVADVPVYASALCAEMIGKGVAFKPEPKFLAFLLKLVTLFGIIRLKFAFVQPIKSAVKIVQEGGQIPGANGLQVINAPGHTADQIAIFTR